MTWIIGEIDHNNRSADKLTTTIKLKFNTNKLEYIDITHKNKYLKKFSSKGVEYEDWRNLEKHGAESIWHED